MSLSNSNTTPEHICDIETATKQRPPRRRAAHAIVRVTEIGQYTLCGKLIAARNVRPVKVDKDGIPYEVEYYKCPGCASIAALEEEMAAHWPSFRVDATQALDLAPHIRRGDEK